jgi:hypothetical protein
MKFSVLFQVLLQSWMDPSFAIGFGGDEMIGYERW